LWLGVHILFLVGFRNRYVVFFQWLWAYVTFQRGARLITSKPASFQWPSQPRRLTKKKKRVDPFDDEPSMESLRPGGPTDASAAEEEPNSAAPRQAG
jgi:hypothetical protein